MLSARTSKRLDGIETCSKNGFRAKRLFQVVTNYPDLWEWGYALIHDNRGAITKGVNTDTLDGFSKERIARLTKQLKDGTYKPTPVRRTYVPKANGNLRPLGLPSGTDKLVQSVVRIILERIYEPVFSDRSHGFRPRRSCHTALKQIQQEWTSVKWIINIDIKGFYDNIDHQRLVQALEVKIEDRTFIKLIKAMLKAGYLEDWVYHRTYSGAPQGGVASPILANVYLHELDQWMERRIERFNQGKRRRNNPAYQAIAKKILWLRKKIDAAKAEGRPTAELMTKLRELDVTRRQLPSLDVSDPDYRRLLYCRYADDLIIGVIGTKAEAETILQEVRTFLNTDLKLTLSEEKTGIKHSAEKTRFLGYDVQTNSHNKLVKQKCKDRTVHRRSLTGAIQLLVPRDVIRKFLKNRGYGVLNTGKIQPRIELINYDDLEIARWVDAEFGGFARYYALANQVKRELNTAHWIVRGSLLKTLAAKHKTTGRKILRRYRQGERLVIEYEAKGKTKRYQQFLLKDLECRPNRWDVDLVPNPYAYTSPRTSLLKRLNASKCELCGTENGPFEVHHVRKLADLKNGIEAWKRVMIVRQRKTLIVCTSCHDKIHAGKLESRLAA